MATSAEELIDQATGEEGGETDNTPAFSMELNQDQKDIRDWVHGFAETSSARRPRSGTSVRKRRGP